MEFQTQREELDFKDEVGLGDYLIVPRPQELIQKELKSSSPKLKESKVKPLLKESSFKREPRNPKEKATFKEKLEKSKDARKSVAKARSVLVSSKMSKVYGKLVSRQDMEKKFQAHLQEAKRSISKYRCKSEISSKEATEKQGSSAIDEHSTQEQQLLKRMKESAFTAQDRYDVLNTQDTYIRHKDAKSGESKAKKINGTCPDMCPEKERYSRVAKNCLSIFETKMALDSESTKDVDYSYMIKEYSRSSADQQEPLPHELRPVPVLMFTMDYLICNIINRQENNISIADWYDFIWNRTRSIRKDITQQQLCDVQCVDILEKCARFHILCAEALSEEDTATFDPKINNENLTKCLQTLKHMYHDLQTKGIQCPNEAEFRAYDILLSLTEGETLRLVKDVRKEVFKSPLVKSAFEAALAFKSNNYVKFFKLMENATYLSSCIMHRYIHEARVHAVQVIIRAYSLQNNSTLLPLSSLVKDLKFENDTDAANFCKWHGLVVDETHVTIQRQAFSMPATAYPIARVTALVGKKLETSLGVIVNNAPLPQNPLQWYQPKNSFDDSGMLQDKMFCSLETEVIIDGEEEINFDHDMEVENSTTTFTEVPTTIASKQSELDPIRVKAAESDVSVGEFSDFKVQTFENYINSKLKQKTNSVNSLSNNTPKAASSVFKTCVQKEKTIAVCSPSPVISTSSPTLTKPPIPQRSFFSKVFGPPTELKSALKQPGGIIRTTNFGKELSFRATSQPKSFQWPAEKLDKVPLCKSAMHSPDTMEVKATAASNLEVPVVKALDGYASLRDLSDSQQTLAKSSYLDRSIERDKAENVLKYDKRALEEDDDDDEEESDVEILPLQEVDNRDDSDVEEGFFMSLEREDEETLTKIRDQKIDELISDITDEVIEELSVDICKHVVNEEWDIKNDFDHYVENIQANLARKVVHKWRLFCERRRQRNTFRNSVPLSPWVPMLMNTEYVTSGATSPYTVYKKHCSLSRLADSKLKQRETKPGWEPMTSSHFECLNNQFCFPPAYLRATGVNRFFKLGLVFVNCADDGISYFNEWMCTKFKLSSLSDDPGDKANLSSFFTLNGGKTVVCVRAVVLESQTTSKCDKFLNGMSAMILCCPARFSDLKVFTSFLNQFSFLLEDSNQLSSFPLFTFLLATRQKNNVMNQLASFLDDRLYSGSSFSTIKMNQLSESSSYISNSNEVVCAVKWLIDNQEPVPVILNTSLRNYLEDSFASVFNTLFWKLSLQEFKPLFKMPQHTITFYNKMLDFRANVLCSEFLMSISKTWPPQELFTLQPEYRFIDMFFQKKVEVLIKSLYLPEFDGDPSSLEDLWHYVRKVAELVMSNNAMLFISVQNILQNGSDTDWPTILSKCAYHLLCSLCSTLTNDLEESVYYLKDEWDAINFESFWQNLLSLNEYNLNTRKRKVSGSNYESPEKRRKEITQELFHSNVENYPDFGNISVISDIPDAASCHVEDVLSSLKSALKEQNEESDRFLLKLNESILGESLFPGNDPHLNNFSDHDFRSSTDEPLSTPKSTKLDNLYSSESMECVKETKTPSGSNSWDKFTGKKNNSTIISSPACISEKLAELRYNIQKNNILEDNMSLLLDL